MEAAEPVRMMVSTNKGMIDKDQVKKHRDITPKEPNLNRIVSTSQN